MPKTLEDLIGAARAKVSVVEPKVAYEDKDALVLDIREAAELAAEGTPPGALHIPRGLLEFKADGSSELADDTLPRYQQSRQPVNVLCARGGRAFLAAAVLSEMGYEARVIRGGLNGWKEADLPVERP